MLRRVAGRWRSSPISQKFVGIGENVINKSDQKSLKRYLTTEKKALKFFY